MKFIHLGDLHIGKSLSDFDLISDQEYILDQIIDIAREQKVDGFLLAGDIYDKAIPSEAAVRLFDNFIGKLVDDKFKVFIISGNHDSDERLNFGSRMFEAHNVYISSKYNGLLYEKIIEDDFGELHVYLMPFVKASQVRHFYPEAVITTYDDAVRVAIEKSGIDPNQRNLLVAHQFVAGHSGDIVLAGSEGLGVQNVGAVEMIGYDCFDAFDYVALGHIHAPQSVGRDQVRYAGSPLKYSLSEVSNCKSVPVVTLGAKGDVDVELIPLKPKRDLRHITGTMKQLLDETNLQDTDDFIYATLTDEDTINDVMGIFQQYYPNTVRIDYNNSHTKEIENIDVTNITKDKSFDELFCEFYEMMYGCEISEDEMAFIRKVAREAGVIHEAD